MMSIGLHCRPRRAAGPHRRARTLYRLRRRHERVWFARRIDIARHWLATYPFAG